MKELILKSLNIEKLHFTYGTKKNGPDKIF